MANRYWVGGTGNWSDATNHWSDTSNGTPNASYLPTSSDNVYFDANSGSGTVTIAATAYCLNFDASATSILTIAGSSSIYVYGSFTLKTGMTISNTGTFFFSSTSTGKTITWASNTINSTLQFNGVGGGWTFQDDLTFGGSKTIYFSNGSLDTNSKNISAPGTYWAFYSNYTNTRSLTAGTSTFSDLMAWTLDATNATVSVGSSTITFRNSAYNSFNGGGETYGTVNMYNGYSTDSIITGSNTFTNLTFNAYYTVANVTVIFKLSANQTITGTFTIAGVGPTRRVIVKSDTHGTSRTITAATVSVNYADLYYITGAGAGSWNLSSNYCGNMGGCSNITFPTSVTRYLVGSGNLFWSNTSSWSDTPGGSSGASVPLCHDTVVIDSNSSPTAIYLNVCVYPSLDFSGLSGACDLNVTANSYIFILGTINFTNIDTIASVTFISFGVGDTTFTSDGITLTMEIRVDRYGKLTINDDITSTSSSGITVLAGTIDFNDFNITLIQLIVNSGGILYLGNGTTTLNEGSFTGGTVYCESSTIVMSGTSGDQKSFSGSGQTYNIVTFTGDNIVVYQSNTFATLNLNNAGLTTGTKFYQGTTQTINNFSTNGSSGNLVRIRSSSTSTNAILNYSGSGYVDEDYVDIDYITGSPASTWYMGTHSTNGGHNSQIYFTTAPVEINDERDVKIVGFSFHQYSRENRSSLPTNANDLAMPYTGEEMTDAGLDDNNYIGVGGYNTYNIHVFKNANTTTPGSIQILVKTKSSIASSSSTIYLQIWNISSSSWENIASDSSTSANTEFTLQGDINTSIDDYCDVNNQVAFRLYQQVL